MKAVTWYLREIDAAKKREKKFREKGKEILEIYEGKKQNAFNILYTNTETLLPALYSAVPKPIVERRYKDADPLGKASSEAAQRGLSFLFDTNVEGYETFDEGIRAAILDALLPGRGVTAVHYDAEITGDLKGPELVCLDAQRWDKVYFGYAKKWSDVPWVCYEFEVDKDEAKALFGKLPDDLKFTNEQGKEVDEKSEEGKSQVLTATIYRLQDKKEKKILFLSENVKDQFLKVVDDPLGITGFLDCPKPIMFMEKNDLCPSALYSMYEVQAKELNRIQVRIQKLVEAIKARGVYDGELSDEIANLLEQEENALVPTDKSASLSAEGGLQNAIWMMPLEMMVAALQQLYVARDSTKQVIFEIIGLADIMRGASNASETLGAQQIKQQWGSLRLKRLQKEVMRYVRDCERMMLEVAANKFSEDTWAKMTGLPFLTQAQAMQLEAEAKAMQAQMKMLPPPMPGQQPDPQVQQFQQQFQQLQQQLQTPKWSDVLGLLRDDIQRAYRIDIETNSTLDPEAADDQRQMGELLNGIGQALNGIGPLVENGTLPFDAAKGIVMMVTRKFPVGKEVEDLFAQMQAPQKQDPAQAEAAKEKAKQDAETQRVQAQEQTKQAQLAKEATVESEREKAKAMAEVEKAREETVRFKMELDHKERLAKAEIQSKKDTAINIAKIQRDGKRQETAIQVRGQKQMAQIAAGKQAEEGEPVDVEALVPQLVEAVQMIAQKVDAIAGDLEVIKADAAADPELIKGPDGMTQQIRKGSRVMNIKRTVQ